MLIARIRDSRITLQAGKSLPFVAPWTGELSFRLSHHSESPDALSGDLHVTLERVFWPPLVDKDGKTTITTRVSNTKYLLFEPEGIRWQYSNFMSATDEPDYPTLINGIAWWPLPDKPNTEGKRELTLTIKSPLVKTRDFVWVADPNGSVLELADDSPAGRGMKVQADVSPQGLRHLRMSGFPDIDQGLCSVSLRVSRRVAEDSAALPK